MDDGIRVFLESPPSLEPASDGPCKGRRAPARPRRRRGAALPPYVPFTSVYEQSDLTRLTERQALMALKFQANRDSASALFLAVNGICPRDGAAGPATGENQRKGPRKTNLKMRTADAHDNSVYMQSKRADGRGMLPGPAGGHSGRAGGAIEADTWDAEFALCTGAPREDATARMSALSLIRLRMAPLRVRLPFRPAVVCAGCREGICDLLRFLGWCSRRHRACRHGGECRRARDRLAFAVGRRLCVCEAERAFYAQALFWGNLACCRPPR